MLFIPDFLKFGNTVPKMKFLGKDFVFKKLPTRLPKNSVFGMKKQGNNLLICQQ